MLRPTRLAVFLSTIATVTNASAAEICGNGIDDDGDLLVDEQCYPGLTTGQCESPLSCAVLRATDVLFRELTFA